MLKGNSRKHRMTRAPLGTWHLYPRTQVYEVFFFYHKVGPSVLMEGRHLTLIWSIILSCALQSLFEGQCFFLFLDTSTILSLQGGVQGRTNGRSEVFGYPKLPLNLKFLGELFWLTISYFNCAFLALIERKSIVLQYYF